MLKKFGILLYLGAGFFFFLFWLYWVFPSDALKSRILTEIENRTQGRYKIDVADLDVSLLGGLTFKNLKVSEGMGGAERILLKTPKLKLGASPLGLISGKLDFNFYMKGSKGDVEGKYKQEGDAFALDADFDKFPLADLGILSVPGKMNLSGQVDGELRLNIDRRDSSKNSGNIDLRLMNLTLGATKLALDPSSPETAMDIPEIKLSGAKDSGIQGEVKKDVFEISGIHLKGGDLDLSLSGRATLQGPRVSDYRLALQGNFSITETLAKALPFLFIIEQQKNAQGVYPLSITGRLAKPNIRVGTFNLPI